MSASVIAVPPPKPLGSVLAPRRSKILYSLGNNAYGMYLIHYAFVSWLQYLVLPAAWPAVFKGCVVFAGTTLLSWGSTAGLRRISAIARTI